MRGLRSAIALLVTLAALSAYIYFVTWKKTDSDAGPKLEKVFASLDTTKVDELKVKAESGETTTLKKANGVWQLQAPESGKADDASVSGILSGLVTLEITRAIDENPSDDKVYGLASPRIEVDFKADGDKDYRKLFLGDKSPTGAQIFARRNDEKRVFVIPSSDVYNKSTFDLRDKTLLTFDRDKVDGLEITADGKTLQLGKSGPDWKIAKPLQAKADYGSVEGLAGRLQTSQMKSLVTNDAPSADLKKYGLDKPAITATVVAGSSRATLLVGGKTADNTLYARDASRPAVFTIESALGDELRKGADEYRRKDLFDLRSYNTSHLEVTRNGQTVVFEMTKGTGEKAQNTWKRISPNPANVDRDKTEGFLAKLSNLRATSFVDTTAKTGLDSPVLGVRAKFEDTKDDGATFGKTAGGEVYAAVPGEPGAARIDPKEFDDVLKALDEVAK